MKCPGFSLAEWFLIKEKTLPLPVGVVEQKNVFQLEIPNSLSLFGVIEDE